MITTRYLATKARALRRRLRLLITRGTRRYLASSRGVIHVGANTGQERLVYAALGIPVLWVEPVPEVFAKLEENIKSIPNQIAVNCLLTDKENELYTFYIASNNAASSSIFHFKLHKDLWPEVRCARELQLRSTTLARLVTTHKIDLSFYDTLVIDTQGSELLVLMGAVPVLSGFRLVLTEAADFEAYEGSCRYSEISDFLSRQGFLEVYTDKFAELLDKRGAYYELVFQRG